MCTCMRAGPTNYGPTAEAATPWVQLALYTSMRAGPLSVVLVCGQRLWRLPPQLRDASHALLWPWNMDSVRAHVRAARPFSSSFEDLPMYTWAPIGANLRKARVR